MYHPTTRVLALLELLQTHRSLGGAEIAQRLGGERHQRLHAVMQAALAAPGAGDLALHREWITALLTGYYDPMYAYQHHQKAERIVFAGNAADVLAYLRTVR